MTYDNAPSQTSNALIVPADFEPVLNLALAGLGSPHSKRAYRRALNDFMSWWQEQGRPRLSKAVVLAYRETLGHLAPASANQRLAAVRRLIREAADNGIIDQVDAQAIAKVKGIEMRGTRAGNWLTKAKAELLLMAPPADTLGGLRDRAILGLMIGAGLRRSEVASLTFEHIQQREGRWAIVDLVGKHGRIRTVPVPSWCKVALDRWQQAAGLDGAGFVFRPVYHGGRRLAPGDCITPQAVYRAVRTACYTAGVAAAPHDLRRTFAKLARKGGGDLVQLQVVLGHASPATTQRYLNEELNFADSPCDRLGLELSE
jgi:integrase